MVKLSLMGHVKLEIVQPYLSMQAEAGANALQIFDSWVGAVNADQYKQGIYPHMERIIKTVKAKYPHLPMAMNGVGTDHLVSIWSHLPLDVIALDWRSSIVMANERGVTQTVQGNLDPAYLFGDEKTLAREVDRILLEGVRYGRHIFNLGHGVFPEADPQKLHWLTDYVHERSRELWAQEG